MKNISIKASLFALALGVNSGLLAQSDSTSIDRSVDVVNAYQPTLHRAARISIQPTIDDTVKLDDSFKYQLLNRVETVTTKPETLSAASMDFPGYESPYRVLLEAGVGTLPSFRGQVTYNAGASERYRISLNAGHDAQLGKAKLENDKKVDAHNNDTWAGVNFNRFHEHARFGFNFSFKNSAYSFYGLNAVSDTLSYLTEAGHLVSGGQLHDDKQRTTSADIDFCVGNAMVDPSEKFTFAASAGLGFFGNKFGAHQTDVRFGGALRFPAKGSSAIDVDLGVNIFKSSGGDTDSVYTFLDRKGVDINVFPHFVIDEDYMLLRLGLRLISVVGDDYTKDDFIVQPDLNADFFIGDGSVRFYAGLTGDYAANSFRRLTQMNRYVSPDCPVYIWDRRGDQFVSRTELRPSQSPILFKIGARAAFGKTVQLHFGFDFRSLGDEVFFVNRNFALATDLADTTLYAYNGQFALVQDDGKLVRLHGELNINPTENSNILIAASYSKYTMDYIEEPWGRVPFTLTLVGNFRPVDRLQVKASLDVVGKTKAFDAVQRKTIELDAFPDLNIGANYYISNRWTAFLNLNNICCADQQRRLGYSSYRFNAMAGITYKF